MKPRFDFSGWATKNDLRCSDGRTIRRDAFKDNDGTTVPLVWQHQHNDPSNVLGHALLENRDEGVFAYCTFNETDNGQHAKALVQHGDITALSIYANQLKQHGSDVLHGVIKEVSLVLAGANPGATIINSSIAHSDGTETDLEDEAMIFTGENISLAHADDDEGEKAPENDKENKTVKDEKTVKDVFDEFTEEQKQVVYFMIGQALEDSKNNDNEAKHSDLEGDDTMKYNVFDSQTAPAGTYLSHSDEAQILADAKDCGSFKKAFQAYAEANELAHADGDPAPVSGFDSYPVTVGTGVEALFPEWHDVRPGAPEIVTNDQAWVKTVLGKAHRTPFNRIRTSQVDLQELENIRAKGYPKGMEKKLMGMYAVAKRTTSPTTVYAKSALNRDDVNDITDFDYIDYQYKIDRMQLEKEVARAALIGDGRETTDADKIDENCIRPIWTDDETFVIHKVLRLTDTNGTGTAANFGDAYRYASAAEELLLDAKIDYRGSGNMDMFCQQQFFNKMLLAKDRNGRRMYANKNELMATLDVNSIQNVPEFANLTRTVEVDGVEKTYRLLAIIGNLTDYSMGATKGGEITHFTDFDIDFNQHKSLIETRLCGAVTRIKSFIVIEEEVA
jgi:hypothetical protein